MRSNTSASDAASSNPPQDRRAISNSSANDLWDLSRLRAFLRARCLASSIANNRRWCAVRALELRRGCCSSFRMTAFAAFCTTFAMAAFFVYAPRRLALLPNALDLIAE